MSDTGKVSVWARRRARRALVQAMYQRQLSANDVSVVMREFEEGEALKKADGAFFEDVFKKCALNAGEMDDEFADLLDRPIDQLDQIERAILRLATTEFKHRIDVPYRVVIDEYVELAKTFGAQDSYKYINGVLDKIAATLRAIEVNG